MTREGKLLTAIALVIAGAAAAGYTVWRPRGIRSLTGAVLRQDSDPRKQFPIASVEVSVTDGASAGNAVSDPMGLFRLKLREGFRNGEIMIVHLRHPDYRPMDIPEIATDRLMVLRMTPVSNASGQGDPPVAITDIRIRFAIKDHITQNIGSAAKTFEVVNAGDVPCERHGVCSPDGRWKAGIGSAALDAGDGNEFQHARVFCIAGPCPFTKIENDGFSRGGRNISVAVRNWSDTASFVLEAEVTHAMNSDAILQSFPVIANQSMSFTLPASAQGPSIEATLDRQEIVFPLGPALKLSWADCTVQVGKDLTKLYRCALKPGYKF